MSQSTCLSGSILKTVSTLLLLGLSANIHATTAADFDIERYSTAGAGWFETFHVQETQALQQALKEPLEWFTARQEYAIKTPHFSSIIH